MPKCENCYHFDICIFHGASGCERCMQYKDKSLIVELPCKVGDDLYWISDENKVECLKNEIIGVVVKNDGFEILDTDGNIDKLGTRFTYLTREEAEKALRECGNDG